MNKESSAHKCLACDKIFKAASDLNRHLKDKHENVECPMCKKSFSSRKQAEDHICLEGDIVPLKCDKSYCNKEFVSSAALNKHIKNSHYGHQRKVCNKCGEILDSNTTLNKHKESCGKGIVDDENKREKSREVCIHWKRGKCTRGPQCNFSHVGWQNVLTSKQQSTTKTPEPCRNGTECSFNAKGRCHFGHHKSNSHYSKEQSTRPRQARASVQSDRGLGQSDRRRRQESDRARCRFGPKCDRVINCPFIHSMEDFPLYNNKQGFRGTKQNRNNRN